MYKGIDVSHHQGRIDWRSVRSDGVQFAMIRAGFGWDNDQQRDRELTRNVAGAREAGIPYGLYHYSYAMSPDDARKEAAFFLRLIQGFRPEYPVAYDFEEQSQIALPPERQLSIIEAFMDAMTEARFYPALYMSASPMESLYRYAPERLARFDSWVAHFGVTEPRYPGPYGIWQYSWQGKVKGVNAGVDLDYAYKDYPALIRAAGLNDLTQETPPEDGADYAALYRELSDQYQSLKAEHDNALQKLDEIQAVLSR